MRATLNALGAFLVLVGAVWMLQGVGVLGGSFMTGETRWLVIGALTAAVGLGLVGWLNAHRFR